MSYDNYKEKPTEFCPQCSTRLSYILKKNYSIPCIVYYCPNCRYNISRAIINRGYGGY